MLDGFKSLAEIINKEPEFEKIRKIINQSDVVADFYNIFPDLEKIAEAVKVNKKVLQIHVEDSTWRSELKFREKMIVDKINNFYNEERITKIRFVR